MVTKKRTAKKIVKRATKKSSVKPPKWMKPGITCFSSGNDWCSYVVEKVNKRTVTVRLFTDKDGVYVAQNEDTSQYSGLNFNTLVPATEAEIKERVRTVYAINADRGRA